MPPQRNSAVLDDDYGLEKAPVPARAGGVVDKDYGLEPAPVSTAEPSEEDLPGSTPRLRAAVASGKAKMSPVTRTEKETPKIPENYGFTPGHMLENVYEGAKGVVGGAAQGLYDTILGEGKNEAGEEEHGIGALVGLNAKGEFDPIGRGKWLAEKYLTEPAKTEFAKSAEEQNKGNVIPSIGHAVAGAVPIVGPWAASLGEQAGTGDIGGAGSQAAGAALGGEIMSHPTEIIKGAGALADKAVRGTPLTEVGKLKAAAEQIKTVKPPLMSETEYAQKVNAALPDLQRIAQENQGKIKTPREAVAAISNRISQIEAPISQQLEAMPDSQQMVSANTIRAQIDSAVDAELNSKRTQGQYKPEEIQKAKDTVAEFIGNQDKPLRELEGNRRRLNQDADQYFRSSPADKRAINASDATAVAQRAAGKAIRNIEYGDGNTPGELERVGITARDAQGNPINLRDVRKTTGNLIDIRDHFEDAITRAEQTGDWSAFNVMRSGPSLAMGGLGALTGAAAGGPLGAVLGTLLGEGGKAWADYRKSKNINLNTEKAFRNLGKTSAPNTLDVSAQAPPPPVPQSIQITPASVPTSPPPVPASAAVQPTGTITSTGQLGTHGQGGVRVAGQLPETSSYEVPPIVPQFVREIAPQPAPRPPIKAMLPPERTTTIPPMVEEPFAREEVRPPAGAGERAREEQLGIMGRGGIRQGVAGELPEISKTTEIGQEVNRLKARQKELKDLGNKGAARAVGVRIEKLEEQLPEEAQGAIGRIGGPGREGPLERIGAEEPKKKGPQSEIEQIPYTRPMPIPPSKLAVPQGITTPAILHHELGHAIVGALNGFESDGIVTHRYPGMSGRGATAAAVYPMEQFFERGQFKKDILINGGERLSDLYAAGAAANELVDGIHRDKNPGLWGDKKAASRLFSALDIPVEKHGELFNAAVDRAKEKLSASGITDLIRSEGKFREDNLPVEYHYSKNRIGRIMQEVRRLQNEPAEVGSTTADFSGRGGGGEETVAGGKSVGAQEPRKAPAPSEVKPFKPPKNIYDIEIAGGGQEPRTITIEALNRKKAFELAQKQNPGSMEFKMTGERKPEIGPPFEMAPFSELRRRPLVSEARGEEGPVKVADIGRMLGEYAKEKVGKVTDKTSMANAVKLAAPEIKYQIASGNSGLGWYAADTDKAIEAMSELHPELKDPAKASLFKTFWSALSYGKNPADNMMLAEKAYDLYKKNGTMPITQPGGKAWGVYKAGHEGNMKSTQALIDKFGEKGAVDWLLSKHPVSELREFNKNVEGKAGDQNYGSMIYGPKGGHFYLNLNGVPDVVTVDKWMARTWRRWSGTLSGKNVDDAPSPAEIRSAREAVGKIAQKLNLEPRDAQAVLWYYEQDLYKQHGAKAAGALSYGNEARRIVDERKAVQAEGNAGKGGGSQGPRKLAAR